MKYKGNFEEESLLCVFSLSLCVWNIWKMFIIWQLAIGIENFFYLTINLQYCWTYLITMYFKDAMTVFFLKIAFLIKHTLPYSFCLPISLECFRKLSSYAYYMLLSLLCLSETKRILAHLSWKLKWAILIACRPSSVWPSVHLSVCPQTLHTSIFFFWTTGPISTKLGTNHPW